MSTWAWATTPPTWPPWIACCTRAGISLLHTITQAVDRPIAPFTDRHIFPGGHLPTVQSIIGLLPEHDFHAIDYESLRRHYARTLQKWWERFEGAREQVREMYDERFVRMWRLYLRGAFAAFDSGELDLAQVLWTKGLTDAPPMTRDYMYPQPLARADGQDRYAARPSPDRDSAQAGAEAGSASRAATSVA